MYVNKTNKNPYTKQLTFDVISVILGLSVIVVGVFTFIQPEERAFLFPVIFFLASIFQLVLALSNLSGGYRKRKGKRKSTGVGICILAGTFFILAIVSAICLWR